MKWIRQIWDFLGNEKHRGPLGFIGGIAAFVIGYFYLQPAPPPPIPEPCDAFMSSVLTSHHDLVGEIGSRIDYVIEPVTEINTTEKRDAFRKNHWDPVFPCAKALVDQGELLPKAESHLAAFVAFSLGDGDIAWGSSLNYAEQAVAADPKNPYAIVAVAWGRFVNTMSEPGIAQMPSHQKYLRANLIFDRAIDLLEQSIRLKPTSLGFSQIHFLSSQAMMNAFNGCMNDAYENWERINENNIDNAINAGAAGGWEKRKKHIEEQRTINRDAPSLSVSSVKLQNREVPVFTPADRVPPVDEIYAGKIFEICDLRSGMWFRVHGDHPRNLIGEPIN